MCILAIFTDRYRPLNSQRICIKDKPVWSSLHLNRLTPLSLRLFRLNKKFEGICIQKYLLIDRQECFEAVSITSVTDIIILSKRILITVHSIVALSFSTKIPCTSSLLIIIIYEWRELFGYSINAELTNGTAMSLIIVLVHNNIDWNICNMMLNENE